MEYINAKTAAKKWGIGERRVRFFCTDHKIPGAVYLGKQWMIPADVPRPIDRRTKEGRALDKTELYRFPVMIFSSPNLLRSDLEDGFKRLLDAQELFLQGDFGNCTRMLKELLKNGECTAVQMGCHTFLCRIYLMLGRRNAYQTSLCEIEKLTDYELYHREDFRMILASLRYYYSGDPTELRSIQPESLSADALDYYRILLLECSAFGKEAECENAIRQYEILCREYEVRGKESCALIANAAVAVLCLTAGKEEAAARHMKAACQIAVKNNWANVLSTYFNGQTASMITEYLVTKKPAMIDAIRFASQLTDAGYRLIHDERTGTAMIDELGQESAELILSLCYRMTDQDIAAASGIKLKDLKDQIRSLCGHFGVANRVSLVNHIREHFEP